MLALALRAGRQCEQLVFRHAGLQRDHIADRQPSIGQRAGLVKRDGVHLSHFFQCFTGLDDHTVFGRLPDGGHDRRGRRQHQGAGTEHDQHGHSGYDMPGEHISADRNEQRRRDQPAGSPVRNALHGRLLVFRLLHHADELLQRAVLAHPGRCDVDRTKAVDGAAEYGIPRTFVHRQAFPGHDRLIHRGLAAADGTVHRDGLAGQNAQHIAAADRISGDDFFTAVPDAAPLRGREPDETVQPLFGAVGGRLLEQCADRHDESHLAGGKQIANGDGCKHGNGNQQRGGDFADAGIVDDAPHRKIEQGNAADDHGHPGGVDRENGERRRAVPSRCQMRDQVKQQENAGHNGHRQTSQTVVDLFEHENPSQSAARPGLTCAAPRHTIDKKANTLFAFIVSNCAVAHNG